MNMRSGYEQKINVSNVSVLCGKLNSNSIYYPRAIFSILHCNLTNYTGLFKVAINGIGIFFNYDLGKKIITGIKIQHIS